MHEMLFENSFEQVAAPCVKLPLHVVLLTNFVAPHKRPMYVALAKRVEKLTILISTPMEANRRWDPDWESLNVRVLRTSTINRQWKHPAGFSDPIYIHVPWNTISVLKELNPDVIISGELGFRSVFSALYKMTIQRTPLVLFAGLSEHTEQGRGWTRSLLRKWLVRRADCVAVNGESGARYIRQLGVDADRIRRVHYSTLPGAFDDLPKTRDIHAAHRLLFVGQLIERKGIVPFTKVLASWAARHPERKIEFTLAGSGPLEEPLRTLDRPKNLQLHLLGQCNYEQVSKCYAESGIFAFPSLADDWGMAVNEAMTAGLPVLGGVYSQAVEEMCLHGETGWPFRADHQDEMERAIDVALSTPVERLNEMRANVRERVALMTPETAAENLVEAIQVAMKARHN